MTHPTRLAALAVLSAAALSQAAPAAAADCGTAGPVTIAEMTWLSAATLAHVFNHGTHHRGQITAALTALGQPCPELDFVYFLQNPTKP